MVLSDVIRAVLVAAAAACLFLDAPAAPIFVLATLTSLFGTSFRCAQRALMPALANDPEELTASNGISSTIESLSFFVGPAIGSHPDRVLERRCRLRSQRRHVPVVARARAGHPRAEARGGDCPRARGEADRTNEGGDSSGSCRAASGLIAADRDLLSVAWLIGAQTIVAGASAVFLVVMAVDILGIGAAGRGLPRLHARHRRGDRWVLGDLSRPEEAARTGPDGRRAARGRFRSSSVVVWPSVPSALLAVALLGLRRTPWST